MKRKNRKKDLMMKVPETLPRARARKQKNKVSAQAETKKFFQSYQEINHQIIKNKYLFNYLNYLKRNDVK